MAFRGRGRGRGYGGGGFRAAKQEPFVLFPGILQLLKNNIQHSTIQCSIALEIDDFPDVKAVTEELTLVTWSVKLQRFWNNSSYYLKDEATKKKENPEIERFSDKDIKKSEVKSTLEDFIKRSVEYFPAELAEGGNKTRRGQKRVRWNPESDLEKLDIFEKLELKHKGQDEKGEKEKKEGEGEEEDEEKIEEEEEEFSDDGDYNQNIDFDDDEDDFNMDDGNDDEPIF